ncbi:MAG TPA: ThuA domain-containing protein, partial [Pirellulaceae bacterium]|nr:ThuA domain-containing protein [Pirellulaceae bacterium]
YREDAEGREPWTWVRTHGKGRVFYTAWGHDNRTWNHPGFHNLVERGIRWAVGDDPSQVPAFSDGPEMTALRKDLKPFEYVEADIPFYPPGKQWGALDKETKRKMQLPVSPEESVKHMVTPAGFDIRLFVSEAKLQGKPIAMAWDERGRLWLCETLDYPNELQPAGKGRDRIRICEDTDGDGKADKFAVFAEQLSIPSSIAFYRGGAIVQDGTNTLYLKDVDGDDKADIRKTLATGWALGDTHGGVSNFQYGLDNWYYGMQGYNNSEPVLADGRRITSFRMGFFRFRMKGDGQQTEIADLEFLRSTNNNTWGLGLSEEGLVFGSTANGNPSEFMPIPNRYYEAVRGWSSTVLNGIADSNKFDPLDPNKVRQVDHHGGFTAAAGHALYTARNYPQEYWNRTAFVTEPTGHLVATFVIRGDGAGFRSKNSWNLLASDDEWCAPIMAEVGPDGNVWVLDWYNFIVQHNPTPAGFKTGKGNAYESELRDKKHGRIYRLVYVGEKAGDKSADKASSKSSDSVSTLSLTASTPAAQLVAALKSDNYFWRRQAQRLLVERGQRDVVPALVEILADRSVDAIGLNTAVNHALWTLQGLGVLDGKAENAAAEEAVLKVVKDHRSAGAVRNAILVAPPTAQAVQVVASAPLAAKDPQVRLAVLLWLADLPAGGKIGREMAKVLAIEADPSETERTWIGANGEAVGKAVAEVTRPTTDRWLLDAATAAAARHDREFLKAVILELRGRAGDGPVAKKSAFLST